MMIVTNIVPCIKVTRENKLAGMDIYIEYDDEIKVTYNGSIVKGIFKNYLIEGDGEFLILLLDNGEILKINSFDIEDIE